jgi:hypothetical protein
MRPTRCIALLALVAAALIGATAVQADPPRRHGYHDTRHGHHRYYHPHGDHVRSLPRGFFTIRFGGHPYYYHSGSWYRRRRAGYVVGPAPIGVVVPWLPRYHTTVWYHGFPYYYANLTYYTWDHHRNGYLVVEKPGPERQAVTRPSDLFIYPSRGQSEAQQADDRYECHAWAVRQTAYDPSVPLAAEQQDRAGQLRSDYLRAMSACLEGRGYTVK